MGRARYNLIPTDTSGKQRGTTSSGHTQKAAPGSLLYSQRDLKYICFVHSISQFLLLILLLLAPNIC